MMCSDKPKAYDDIDTYLLFDEEDGRYLVGSISSDSYIIVDEGQKDIYLNMLKTLDGVNDISDISELWGMSEEEVIDLINFFSSKNLIVGKGNGKRNSEVNRLSKKICSFSCAWLNKIPLGFVQIILATICIATIGLLVADFCIFIFDDTFYINMFKYKDSYTLGLITSCLIMIPSFLFHEICHALVARKYKAFPYTIDVSLYLCLFPLFYVRINGLYTVKRKNRIKILISGFLGNLFIAVLAIMLWYVLHKQIFAVIALAQINIIIVNLNPFNLTDAYFIAGQLLKSVNIRSKLFQLIATDFRKLFTGGKILMIYTLVNICVVVTTSIYYANYLTKIVMEVCDFGINGNIIVCIFALLDILVYFLIIKIRYKPVVN